MEEDIGCYSQFPFMRCPSWFSGGNKGGYSPLPTDVDWLAAQLHCLQRLRLEEWGILQATSAIILSERDNTLLSGNKTEIEKLFKTRYEREDQHLNRWSYFIAVRKDVGVRTLQLQLCTSATIG
eukprot:569556-Pelagomonas_calceolata.AAC.5